MRGVIVQINYHLLLISLYLSKFVYDMEHLFIYFFEIAFSIVVGRLFFKLQKELFKTPFMYWNTKQTS